MTIKLSSNDSVLPAGGLAFEAKPAITGPGQGGSPVINSEGKLVGIAYAGSPEADVFVDIAPLLVAKGLTVAPL